MFSDARTLDTAQLDCEICIIGGGVAGIAIAREFIGTSRSVILLESGGMEGDPATQALYQGKTSARKYELLESRLRLFGGSSNHWEGMCAPLDDIDFQKRNWIPYSGWPITKEVLPPYYKKAARFLNLSNRQASNFTTPEDLLPENRLFSHRSWRQAHILRIGEQYEKELADAPNIRVVLHANATQIHSADGMKYATHVQVNTLSGKSCKIVAKQFVLACGGIENARLLLLSDGLGNQHDNVGRYFMEHPRIKVGTLFTYDSTDAVKPFEQYIGRPDAPEQIFNIAPSEETMIKEHLLGSAFVVRDVEQATNPPSVLPYISRMMGAKATRYYQMTLFGRVEHAPNPDNRVTLSNDTDALGQRRAQLHVELGELEYRTMRTATTLLARFLAGQQIGLVHLDRWIQEGGRWPGWTPWSWHHMGTTRMSNTPQNGVVDRNCKLHGVDNVYVAGSSVFRTSGWANPTYTLCALAIRLAEHLKVQMG